MWRIQSFVSKETCQNQDDYTATLLGGRQEGIILYVGWDKLAGFVLAPDCGLLFTPLIPTGRAHIEQQKLKATKYCRVVCKAAGRNAWKLGPKFALLLCGGSICCPHKARSVCCHIPTSVSLGGREGSGQRGNGLDKSLQKLFFCYPG